MESGLGSERVIFRRLEGGRGVEGGGSVWKTGKRVELVWRVGEEESLS